MGLRGCSPFLLCKDWSVTRQCFTELKVLNTERADLRESRCGSTLAETGFLRI